MQSRMLTLMHNKMVYHLSNVMELGSTQISIEGKRKSEKVKGMK
jgi:hypothetical protein